MFFFSGGHVVFEEQRFMWKIIFVIIKVKLEKLFAEWYLCVQSELSALEIIITICYDILRLAIGFASLNFFENLVKSYEHVLDVFNFSSAHDLQERISKRGGYHKFVQDLEVTNILEFQ